MSLVCILNKQENLFAEYIFLLVYGVSNRFCCTIPMQKILF